MQKLSWSEIRRPSPETLEEAPRHPIRVVAHNIRSIHNVGAFFRTSDAARIEHLYLAGYTGTPEHPDLHKTALGAQDTVPWSQHDDVHALLDRRREAGDTLAVLEITDTPTRPSALEADHFPLCLVLGNEVHGVDDAIVDRADLALELPQYGAKLSMNVSVAYGIAVYDLVRRARALFGAPETNEASAP
jgi:tRNA G18 (ribose-2'-O)-methylase SpoU